MNMSRAPILSSLLLVFTIAGCGGGGSSDGGVILPPPSGESLTATIRGASFRANRVSSSGTYADHIRIFGLRDSDNAEINLELEFPSGLTGTWPLVAGTSKSAWVFDPGFANINCYSDFNSSITVTKNDSSRIEGTFFIAANCYGTTTAAYLAENGTFSICMTSTCENQGWRDVP